MRTAPDLLNESSPDSIFESVYLNQHLGLPYRFQPKAKIGNFGSRATDRTTILAAAEKARLPLGDWFCSPLHPVTDRLERWGFKTGDFPKAERLARTVVNLPTDTQNPNKVISFLNNHLDLIESA